MGIHWGFRFSSWTKLLRTPLNLALLWKKLMKDVDIEEQTLFLDHVYLGCTQRECKPNDKFIGQYNKMFESCISAGVIGNYQDGTNLVQKVQRGPATWKEMLEKCMERYCELANKKTEQLHAVSHPCLDDHQIKKEELENKSALSEVCSHIVLKWFYLARIGRPDILWSVNKLARSVTKWTQACDRRPARLISCIHFTKITANIVMWAMRLKIVDWGYFKIQTLQEILKTQNPHQAEFCAFLKVEHLYRSVGCERNKLLFLTAQQNLKSSLWTLDWGWTVYQRLTCGIWSSQFFTEIRIRVISISHFSSINSVKAMSKKNTRRCRWRKSHSKIKADDECGTRTTGRAVYHAVRNQFERFRVVLELISRLEFDFRRRGIFFERFDFLVCSKFNHTHNVAVHVHVLWPVCTHTIPFRMLWRPWRFMMTHIYICTNLKEMFAENMKPLWKSEASSTEHQWKCLTCKSFVKLGFCLCLCLCVSVSVFLCVSVSMSLSLCLSVSVCCLWCVVVVEEGGEEEKVRD